MATALARLVSDWYTPKSDIGSDTPTKFHLKPLNKVAIMQLSGMMKYDENGVAFFSYEGIMHTLQLGVIGWSNFFDADDKEVVFTSNKHLNITRLPEDVIDELFVEILDMSKISEDDKKK